MVPSVVSIQRRDDKLPACALGFFTGSCSIYLVINACGSQPNDLYVSSDMKVFNDLNYPHVRTGIQRYGWRLNLIEGNTNEQVVNDVCYLIKNCTYRISSSISRSRSFLEVSKWNSPRRHWCVLLSSSWFVYPMKVNNRSMYLPISMILESSSCPFKGGTDAVYA